MREKKPSAIKKIQLNKATFNNTPVNRLSFVNFFYGNNGTGKSTIAHCIESGEGVEWTEGHSPEDFEIAVYNQDFITANFSDYGGLRGVFTVNKVNIEIQKKIEEKTERRRELQEEYTAVRTALQKKQEEPAHLLTAFQTDCFKKTVQIRNDFDSALAGRKQKKGFVEALLAEKNPVEHDLVELKRLCDTAYDETTREYPLFSRINTASTYGKLPGNELLGRSISSRSDTPFAQFIKALHATDWVRTGHDHYTKSADGKCPFCQQPLPDNFESDIAACFDEQYQKDIDDLVQFQRTYIAEMGRILTTLKNNMSDVLPGVNLMEYQTKLSLLEKSIEINTQRLSEKVGEPTKVISLEDTDSLLLEIGTLIDAINQSVKSNNDVVKGRRASKAKCRDEVMQHFAFILADDVKSYISEKTEAERAIQELNNKLNKITQDGKSINREIAELSSQTVNTSDAMIAINNMLTESGFQGFRLHAKEGVEHTYEVIRENGEVAADLSEGERNFIAFLYFHQWVCGSLNQDEAKDKIVVIDDPVSSMDNTALFFISGIVRTMISICRNNADYRNNRVPGDFIKQIFILTHNVYFHKEITYQQVGYHDSTSFYMIRKKNNVSMVKLCERQSAVPTEMENYNPVQNSYAALWEELRDVQSTSSAKNVMRRILEYYFLQLCGYEGEDLRNRILDTEENRSRFIVPVEGGQPDTSNYELAVTLLSYINASHSVGDDISYTEDSDDVDAYKNVFRLIFEALGQIQHYNMMMGIPRES